MVEKHFWRDTFWDVYGKRQEHGVLYVRDKIVTICVSVKSMLILLPCEQSENDIDCNTENPKEMVTRRSEGNVLSHTCKLYSSSSSSHYLRIARHANYAPGDTSLLYRGGHRYFRIERDDYDIDHVYSRDTYLYLCHETCEGDTQSDTIILLQYPIERHTFSAKQVRFLHIKAYKKSVHLNHIACRRTIYVEVSMLEVNQLRSIKKTPEQLLDCLRSTRMP